MHLFHFLFHIHINIASSVSFLDMKSYVVFSSAYFCARFIYLFFICLPVAIHWMDVSFELTVHLMLLCVLCICIRMFASMLIGTCILWKSFDQSILSLVHLNNKKQNQSNEFTLIVGVEPNSIIMYSYQNIVSRERKRFRSKLYFLSKVILTKKR